MNDIEPEGNTCFVLFLFHLFPSDNYNYLRCICRGPRLGWDQKYEDVPGATECWIEGYDVGFAQKYDKDRADECNDIPGDQYNASWKYGYIDSGLTKTDCDQIKDDPQDLGSHERLQEENRRACYDDGYDDGRMMSWPYEERLWPCILPFQLVFYKIIVYRD